MPKRNADKVRWATSKHSRRMGIAGFDPEAVRLVATQYARGLKMPVVLRVLDTSAVAGTHEVKRGAHWIELSLLVCRYADGAVHRKFPRASDDMLDPDDRVWALLVVVLHELRHAHQYEKHRKLYEERASHPEIRDRHLAYELSWAERDARIYELTHIESAVTYYRSFEQCS